MMAFYYIPQGPGSLQLFFIVSGPFHLHLEVSQLAQIARVKGIDSVLHRFGI